MDRFLADVAAIGEALNQTLNTPAARLDAKSGPILDKTRADLVEMRKALVAAAKAVRGLAEAESPTVQNVNQALKEIARAAQALRQLAELLEQQPDAILRGKRKVENP